MRGKTIQVFLTDGTTRGIKTAEITSNIEHAIFIPRIKLDEAVKRKEVSKPGIYFLFGDNLGASKASVYIGKSKNCLDRIKNHDQNKDFWNYCVIFTSKTDSWNATHIDFLEQLAISKSHESNRYQIVNSNVPSAFNVPETLEADLLDNFDTIRMLLSILGFKLFESIKKSNATISKEIYYCKGRESDAEGEYMEDGFVVFKGSIAKRNLAQMTNSTIRNLRSELIETGMLQENNNAQLIFMDDYLFGSPSAAASQVLGNNANGWLSWKNSKGKSLDEVKRQ